MIQLIVGLVLVAFPIYAGAVRLSFWMIPLLAVCFALAYVGSKSSTIQFFAGGKESLLDVAPLLGLVAGIQLAVVAVLFFIGYGLGAAMGIESATGGFGKKEWWVLGGCFAYVAVTYLALQGMQRADEKLSSGGDASVTLEELADEPLTKDELP